MSLTPAMSGSGSSSTFRVKGTELAVPLAEGHFCAYSLCFPGEDVAEPSMTVVATASNPRFSVSRVDIDRPGNTYTVDTLRDLKQERGADVELYFITGADALASILTWRGAEELFELAQFVGVSRPGVDLSSKDFSHLPADKVTHLEVPALAISSTECRARVARGLPLWYLVPDGVVQYVAKRGLYTAANTGSVLAAGPVESLS